MSNVSKLIILILILTQIYGFSQSNEQLQFDGLYQTEIVNGSRTFLRFYKNKTVLYVTSNGEVEQLKSWFKEELHTRSKDVKGKYLLKNNILKFTLTSIEGKSDYQGFIKSNGALVFKTKSHINNSESIKEFSFVGFE